MSTPIPSDPNTTDRGEIEGRVNLPEGALADEVAFLEVIDYLRWDG